MTFSQRVKNRENADRARRRRAGASYVYFVQGVDGGPIKIGVAVNPRQRLALLQNGSPVVLRVIGLMIGTIREERQLHYLFAEGRLHGEWFDADTPGLLEFIEERNERLRRIAPGIAKRREERLLMEYRQLMHDYDKMEDGWTLRVKGARPA